MDDRDLTLRNAEQCRNERDQFIIRRAIHGCGRESNQDGILTQTRDCCSPGAWNHPDREMDGVAVRGKGYQGFGSRRESFKTSRGWP